MKAIHGYRTLIGRSVRKEEPGGSGYVSDTSSISPTCFRTRTKISEHLIFLVFRKRMEITRNAKQTVSADLVSRAANMRMPARGFAPSLAERILDQYAHVVVVCFLFLGLLGATLAIGRYAVNSFSLRDGNIGVASGDVVYALPDGINCRRMSFDNETAGLTEHVIEPCPSSIRGLH